MKESKVNLPVLVESTAYTLRRAQIRAARRSEVSRNPFVFDDLGLEESLSEGSISSFLYEAEDEKESLFDNEDAKNINTALETIDGTIDQVKAKVETLAPAKMEKTLAAIDDMRGELKTVGKLDFMKLAFGGQDALQDKLLKVNDTTADILAAIGMVADALVASGEKMVSLDLPEELQQQTIQALAEIHEKEGGIPWGDQGGTSAGSVDEQDAEPGNTAPPQNQPHADGGGSAAGIAVFSSVDEIRKFVSEKFEVPSWFSQAWKGGLEAASDEAGGFMKKTGSLLKGVFGKKEKPLIPPDDFADDYMELTLAEAIALAEAAAAWKELVTVASDDAGEAGAEALAGAQTVPTGGLPQGGGAGGDGGGGGQGGGGGGGGLPPGTDRPTTSPGGGPGGKDIATFEDLMNRATAPATQKNDIDFAKLVGNLINKDPKSEIEFVDELPKEEAAPEVVQGQLDDQAPAEEETPEKPKSQATEAWVHNRSLSQWLFETPEPKSTPSLLAEAIFYKDFEDELRRQGVSDEEMTDVAEELADRLDNEYSIQVKGLPKKKAEGGEANISGIPPEVWDVIKSQTAALDNALNRISDLSEKDKEIIVKMREAETEEERMRLAQELEMDTRELEAGLIAGASVTVEENSEEFSDEQRQSIDQAATETNVKVEVEITDTAIERYEKVVSAAEEAGEEPKLDAPPEGKVSPNERNSWMDKLLRRERKFGLKKKAKKKKKKSSSKETKTSEETESKKSGKSSSRKETRTGAAATGQEVKVGGDRGEPDSLKAGYVRRGASLAEALFDDDALLSDDEVDDLHLIRWSRISGLPEDQVIETTGTSKLLNERREERHEEWTDDDLVKLGWLRMAGLHTGEDYE